MRKPGSKLSYTWDYKAEICLLEFYTNHASFIPNLEKYSSFLDSFQFILKNLIYVAIELEQELTSIYTK